VRHPRERLRDMIEAIDRIERYSSHGRAAFDADELIQSWIVHHLQVLGEAARALPDDVRTQAPDVEWKNITGMRHILVHDYFAIDRDIVWSTVEQELRPLKASLKALVQRLSATN
jgi:uncharacterized protein with HEPN domain